MPVAAAVSLRALLLFLSIYRWQLISGGLTLTSLYYKIRKSKRINIVAKIYERELDKYGKISIEIKDGGILSIDLNGHADIVEEARKLVKKTSTVLDDKLVELFASIIGKKVEPVAEAAPQADGGPTLAPASQEEQA